MQKKKKSEKKPLAGCKEFPHPTQLKSKAFRTAAGGNFLLHDVPATAIP